MTTLVVPWPLCVCRPNFQGVRVLCNVKGNHGAIPNTAVSKKYSAKFGFYYEVKFNVALHFLTTLEFKIMSEGKIVGTAVADYV